MNKQESPGTVTYNPLDERVKTLHLIKPLRDPTHLSFYNEL